MAKANHKLLESLQTLQREPFLKLFKELGKTDKRVGLVSLRAHLTRLARLFGTLGATTDDEHWSGCWSNIHMAAALQGMEIDTDIHGDAMWCGPASDFESAKSEVVGRFVAGRLTFEMVFHAYEILGQYLCKKTRSATSQEISRRLMADERHQPLSGLRCTAIEAIRHLPVAFDSATNDARRAIAKGSWIGLGAENIRQFRNALVHGKLQVPDPLDWGKNAEDRTADEQSELFRWQIRLCLMLIQIMSYRAAGSVMVDTPSNEFSVEELAFSLHTQSRHVDDEDDPDEPSLDGIEEAPRFDGW
ncbi:MAG: hypothetical protein OXD42_01315 [Rhodospirillaceae bacterium]|nr:hypothetical protein [Rhodospirillaceae bacterium]